ERADLNANLRTVVAFLPAEFREMNASDTVASDIVSVADTAMTYKAMRNVQFVCDVTSAGATTGTVVVADAPRFGLRDLDPARDSVVIFADADPTTRRDNYWVHADLTGVTTSATACPDGEPGSILTLDGVYPTNGLLG
ncbi:MAG: hypothetical protein GWN83_05765, partial [Gemmatimonadetes bacterium]|nr:hypothetical protein [Gemmatimonadota bacterium]